MAEILITVYGAQGVGKTTIARMIYAELVQHFPPHDVRYDDVGEGPPLGFKSARICLQTIQTHETEDCRQIAKMRLALQLIASAKAEHPEIMRSIAQKALDA